MTPYFENDGITIYHADCRTLLDHLPPIGVVIMDPPYGIAYASHPARHDKKGTPPWLSAQIAGDQSTEVRDLVMMWAGDLPMAVFGSWRRPRPAGTRQVLIWDKGPARGMGDTSLPWKPSFEEIAILGSGWSGHRDEAVLKGYGLPTWVSAGRCHPNEKPVALLRHLIAKAPAGVVLDPCLGSGTTLVAAKVLGRSAIGIEIEERYCEIAARRLAQGVLPLPAAADQEAP